MSSSLLKACVAQVTYGIKFGFFIVQAGYVGSFKVINSRRIIP